MTDCRPPVSGEPPTRTDAEMAQYVREHQCWNADRNVTIADWHRDILAIEAEAAEGRDRLEAALRAIAACDSLPVSGLSHCGDAHHDAARAALGDG